MVMAATTVLTRSCEWGQANTGPLARYFFFGGILIVSTIAVFLCACAFFTGMNFPEPASRPIFRVAMIPILRS
jgi:hypothetical protein